MLRSIAGRAVGAGAPVFVIAEIGLNHGGSLDRALALVDAADWAGASAVKLQTLFAERLVAPTCPAPAHVSAASLREFFTQFELSLDEHRAVVAHARTRGIGVMTTPFCEDVIPALQAIRFDAYKIASGDLTYDGLIAAGARTGRPLVISTGMSSLHEISEALRIASNAGSRDLAVLHCVSAYPAPPVAQNVRAVQTLIDAFRLPVGLSDHGSGLVSAIAAVALGACIYERHLVLDGDTDAIDAPVSSTPAELRAIVQAMNEARVLLGDGRKICQAAEAANIDASRRGLYAATTLHAGQVLARNDIAVLRPVSELTPSRIDDLIGVTLTRDVEEGQPFDRGDLHGAGTLSVEHVA